ncbi:MAG: sugar transferase [candidate division WOR-3 bacterium]
MYRFFIKRVVDIVLSFFGLLLLSPLLLIIALLILIFDGPPIFFLQPRAGKNLKPFKLIKFRTMVNDAEKMGPLITVENDPRITRLGRFLRSTKLDELPQLLNVLLGHMSFVGPRPQTFKYVEMFKKDYEEILKVRPGITDLATLEFHNEGKILSKYEDYETAYIKEILPVKLELNKKYVKNLSLAMDIKIIVKTSLRVLSLSLHYLQYSIKKMFRKKQQL